MQRILINGSTSDVGKAIAKKLKAEGYHPILFGRDKAKLEQMSKDLGIPETATYVIDQDRLDDLGSTFKEVVAVHGKLQGMICCAGFHEIRPLKASSVFDFTNMFHQNVIANLMYAKLFSSKLNSDVNSSIVFLSSTAALLGESGLSAYSAAKGALLSSTRSLAVEFSQRFIRVNSISAGWIETAHAQEVKAKLGEETVRSIESNYPLGFGHVEDLANLAEFLVSTRTKWLTGQNIVLDGGRTLL